MDEELLKIENKHLIKRQELLEAVSAVSKTSDTFDVNILVKLCKEASYHLMQATCARKLVGIIPN